MSKKKDKPCVRYFNMGAWPVYVGFTDSPSAYDDEMKRLNVSNPDRYVGGTHANASTHILENHGTLTFIITIGDMKGRSKSQVAALIAHEAVHVVQEIWSQLGEKNPGDEQEAYLVQQIVQECLQEMWDSNLSRRTEPAS